MISGLFNCVYKVWVKDEDLNSIPLSSTDLKLVELFRCKQKKEPYVLNTKNDFLYKPFSKKFYANYRENSFSEVEIDIQEVYVLKCQKIFINNFPEAICKILKSFSYVIWQLIEALKKGEASLAFISSIMIALGQFIEIFRIVHYSVGVQIAAFEGLLFNPIKGIFVIEIMEKKLNRDLGIKDDPVYKFSKSKLEIDDYLHHWYIDKSVINCDSLNSRINLINAETEKKFEILSTKEFQISSVPNLFPLVNYTIFKIMQSLKKIKELSLNIIVNNCKFSNC